MTMHLRHETVDHPILRVLVTRLRDASTSAPDFRSLVDEITGLLLYAALRDVDCDEVEIETPLRSARGSRLSRPIALAPVLRAGLGMVPAALRLLPEAQVWHLGLYRDETTLDPVAYYNKLEPGSLDAHEVVVLDPMLATAGTAEAVLDVLKNAGCRRIRLVAIIGAPEGLERLARSHPDVAICLAALDERLTGEADPWPPGYILPGLGDAGDRQFGT